MGRKINVKHYFPFLIFFLVSLLLYYPIFSNKIPINGNLLIGLWPPLNFLKWAEFPAGVPFKFMGVDEVREFYPLLDFTYDSIKSGSIPFWNPYNFSGYSHIGNFASAVFYPIHLSMFILGKTWVFILLKLSAGILAGIFTYLYLCAIRLSKITSYFGAIAFAFSATLQIWNAEIWQSAHAFLWLPLALFSIEKLIREGKIHFAVFFGFSIAMSIMAGYIQPTIYLLILSILYSAFRILNEKRRQQQLILKLFFGFLLGFGISAVQLLPAIEAYLLSPRSQVALIDLNKSFLLPLSQLVTLFVPDFFGNIVTQNWLLDRPGQYYENMIYAGTVPLVIASLALFLKKYRAYAFFFLISAFVSLSLTFDLPTSGFIYDLSIPFLSSAIPIRIVFVLTFSLSVLSAIGFEWWFSHKDNRKTIIGLLPIFLIFLGIGAFIYYNWNLISARNFVLPAAFTIGSIFVLLLGQYFLKAKKFLGILLISASFTSSFLFIHKYIAFSDEKFLYPEHPLIEFINKNQGLYRYWGYGSAALPNNFATVYKIYSPEGYDPVNISHYNELLSSSRKGEYEGAFSRSDALLYAVTEFPFKDINDPRYRVMDILGVKYIGFEKGELSKIEQARVDPARYQKVWEQNNFIIFENKKVFPRVFLADRFVLRTETKSSLDAIYDKNIDLRNTVVVSQNIVLPILEEKKISASGMNMVSGNAQILNYNPNRIVIETDANEPKILVLSDAYYPGWNAKVNGSETKIYRVNHALRGVVVPSGNSRVELYYFPPSFYIGILISTVTGLAAVYIYYRSRKNVN